MFSIQHYNYDLPEKRIAQKPSQKRDRSRLLWLRRNSGEMSHHRFKDLTELLLPTDLLVVNNTKVIPARLEGKKETGGQVEVLILKYPDTRAGGDIGIEKKTVVCECLIKASKRPKIGSRLLFGNGQTGQIVKNDANISFVRFFCDNGFDCMIHQIGKVPLPPYIKRNHGREKFDDASAYQTIYARQKGAVAAPTAGLHFSKKLLDRLKQKGLQVVEITLHVGYGTFFPVRASDIREHQMHSEQYSISPAAAQKINQARKKGHRVVAVGTTCVRTLEFMTDQNGALNAGKGFCDLFIYPGYRFKIVDAIITNFHLPKSTLLMLVSAFSGRDHILSAYQEAMVRKYRFYSYGDAMLIG
jgi:S-adenosylmethionine:tRNA ribosyltransferase-isomerase